MSPRPPVADRYLRHAIAADAPPATSVRLAMRGELRLGRWWPFVAEETIDWPRAMTWRARVRMHGLPVRGFDRIVDGRADMLWRLFGVLPLVRASGPDIDRSTAGRLAAELVWLPGALAGPDVRWRDLDERRCEARFAVHGHPVALVLEVGPAGHLVSLALDRWGDPDRTGFRPCPFGALVEAERSFSGFTIPTRLRVGWHVGTPRFEPEGEFFRATIDDATFR